jgi:multidrug resistance protein
LDLTTSQFDLLSRLNEGVDSLNLFDAREPELDAIQKKRSLALIFMVMLMDVIGITLLGPVAPKIVLRYSPSALAVTLITVVYAIGQFIAAPLLGKLGDRVGRRPVLLLSLVGQALGYFVFAAGGSLWILILGRLVGGITSGNLSTSNAYIADISKPEERSKNFGLIAVAWSLGMILGPGLGGLFGQWSLEAPAYVAGGITLVNLVLGFFILPESLPKNKRDHHRLQARDYNPFLSIFDMVRRPGLGMILLVTALFSFAFNGINSTAPLFMIQKFSAETWQLSIMMMMGGVANILTNTYLVPRWVPRFGEKPTGMLGLIGLGIFGVLVFFSPFIWLAFIVNMMGSTMNAFIFPTLTTLSVERVQPRETGELLGVNSAVGSLMNIAGPLFAGLVYDRVMAGAPFWTSAVVLLIAAGLLFRTGDRPLPSHATSVESNPDFVESNSSVL